jgi:hypothetical protein
VQSFPSKDSQFSGRFLELESLQLDEVWYNNWRWGFKFKNGLQSDFDSDYLLKKFKMPSINITRVELFYDTWGGKDHCLCGLKFLGEFGEPI